MSRAGTDSHPMARILVVDDEKDLQTLLAYNLRHAGHEVLLASTATEGLKAAHEARPDLILLDVMLPDLTGTQACRALKADPATRAIPVVMLTAKGEEIDRVVGFELGAEDYVVKPFSPRELLLRIAAILRRRQSAPADEQSRERITFGHLTIDRDAHRVWVDRKEVELTPIEFKLLLCLYERGDRVQARSSLLDDVWGMSGDLTTRTVDTHVKRLREKLGVAAEYIETVRGVGYRFAETPSIDEP